MKTFIVVAGVMLAQLTMVGAVAYAQQPQPKEKEYQLMVTDADLRKISEAIGTMPYKDVAPLFFKLQNQITNQVEPPKKPDATPEKVEKK